MPRPILELDRIHPAVRDAVAAHGTDVIRDVQAALETHAIVIVGMRQNPFPRKARKLLEHHGLPYHYLEYGSYFSGYRRRLPLKMWTGWPTFPMIFVKGTLIGGASDLEALIKKNELSAILAGA